MSAEVASRPLPGAGSWPALRAERRDGLGRRSRRWAASPAALAVATVGYFVVVVDRVDAALLGVVALTALVVVLNNRRHPRIDRCELAATANVALLVAFPFTKLPHDRLTSYLIVVSSLCITGSALRHEKWPRSPVGSWPTGLLFLLLAVVSELSPDAGALKQLATIAVAALPQFLLASRLRERPRHDLAVTIVVLACLESVLALAEPFVFPQHLWAAGLVVPVVGPDPLASSILPGIQRSFATLGLPLPLGLLLVVALALLTRFLQDIGLRMRAAATVLIGIGIVFAGDRNALITAVVIVLCGRRVTARKLLLAAMAAALAAFAVFDAGLLHGSTLTNFLESGSYLHRVAAYDSFHKLVYDQTSWAGLFGNGYSATPRIFARGLLQNDGLNVIDNEFVSMQVQGGVLCLLVLLGLAVTAIWRAGRQFRLVAAAVVVIMLIFDSLLWPSASALTFLVFGLVLNPPPPAADTTDVPFVDHRPGGTHSEPDPACA